MVAKNKPMFKRIIKILVLMFVMVLLGIGGFVLINLYIDKYSEKYIYDDLTQLLEVDAILVLGAFVFESGRPSNVLADRLNIAYELYIAGKAPRIILSGDHGSKDYNEVHSMRDYLLDKGIPRDVLFLDHAGFNTYDSMYRAKEIFGVESMIISTQTFHINRAVYIARRIGIDAYGYPDTKWINYYKRTYGVRESIAKVKAFLDVEITRRKPRFLGEPIPLNGSGIITD